jgi:putative hydrolase of HD superfamily
MRELVREYNEGRTPEAGLAHDADQLALVIELKDLMDIGYKPPEGWIENVISRVKTETGRKIAQAIMSTQRDDWWNGTTG